MKKIIFLIMITFLLSGCVNINKSSYEEIINNAINSEYVNLKNKTSQGFSYYLPNCVSIITDDSPNIAFKVLDYKMYMYVDLISYYNKKVVEYQVDNNAYYSKSINFNDNFGYLEINLQDNQKYLVEIMYKYAKIEVIVEESDLKNITSYAIAILSSLEYNDTILENMLGEDTLSYNEVEFNIFETAKSESNLITYDSTTNSSNDTTIEVPDTDLIN